MQLAPVGFKALILAGLSLTVASCAVQQQTAREPAYAAAAPRAAAAPAMSSVPGGATMTGANTAMMADQYTPRAGPHVATGASAWVRPAPPPAYVATGPMPAAAPPAPPPAAVANRQPSPSPAPAPAVSASEIVRPEAAQPAAAPATPAPNPALRTAGLALFNANSCGACHGLADAGASGGVGPSLDRNPRLTKSFVVDVLTNGRGAMPSFAGQLSPEELDTLAEYILQFSRK